MLIPLVPCVHTLQLYYTPDLLDTYVGVCHEGMVDPAHHCGTTPDDIVGILSEYIPDGEHL